MPTTPWMFSAVDNSLANYADRAERAGSLTPQQLQGVRAVRANTGEITELLYRTNRLLADGSVSDTVWDDFFTSGEFRDYLP